MEGPTPTIEGPHGFLGCQDDMTILYKQKAVQIFIFSLRCRDCRTEDQKHPVMASHHVGLVHGPSRDLGVYFHTGRHLISPMDSGFLEPSKGSGREGLPISSGMAHGRIPSQHHLCSPRPTGGKRPETRERRRCAPQPRCAVSGTKRSKRLA